MTVLLGCIADDFTGATDLANMLVRQGMRTIQLIGVPEERLDLEEADAVVVALKCRSIPPKEAIEACSASLRWLQEAGCRQFFWKYCSTFDSTEKGNIGPVADALLDQLHSELTIACPAFPENKRTVYKGHLFVGDLPLHESSMRHHPLTPMTDSSLVRLLQRQVAGRVGLVPWEVVRQGACAIETALTAVRKQGARFAIVDAIEDQDLEQIARACADLPLITGGSGVALGLPENFRRRGLLPLREDAAAMPDVPGRCLLLSGSCSEATRQQIALAREHMPSFCLDPLQLADGDRHQREAVTWAREVAGEGPALIYSSAEPARVHAIQERLGRATAGHLVEQAFTFIARTLRRDGVRKFIVAGGETSGAVVKGLEITGLRIGPQIDPGVPWTSSLDPEPVALALKSGNFGAPDFFLKALDCVKNHE